jgi:Flp pilus assembly protein TadG
MWPAIHKLWRSERGAVAPTIALSLTALVAVGGIAFDYARLANLDTELQDAADQSALAAASQLDQQSGSIQRATAAAQSLLTNRTLMANDSNLDGTAVTIPTVMFYPTKADAEANTNGFTTVANFANAHFVRVVVAARRANYALTPIVGVFTSGDVSAEAVAGIGSSICKVPPVMICNPQETAGSTSFDVSTLIGKGLKLVSVGNGNGSWSPGNFGYLDTGGGSNGATGLRESLGWGTAPGNCIAQTGVNTKPGASTSVTDALNTRFDIYDSNQSCPTGGSCAASINSRKDVSRAANASGNNSCKLHNQGWNEGTTATAYEWGTLPSSPITALPTTTTPSIMGHPRDMCHSVPSGTPSACTSPIGDGVWDRDAYFRTNYLRTTAGTRGAAGTRWTSADWQADTGLSPPPTPVTASNYASRYNVYKWEIANRGTSVDGVVVLGSRVVSGNGASAFTSYGQPVCSQAQTPSYGSGQVPGGSTTDRRRISVAVVNCLANGVNGNSTNVPVQDWIEIFLVEPSINRGTVTNGGDVYAEVISKTQAGAGSTAGQVVRRDVPYLVK